MYDRPEGRPVTVTFSVSRASSDTVMSNASIVSPCSYVLSPGFVITGVPAGTVSSSSIVPVAVSVAVTVTEVPDTLRPTVNVSSDSSSLSSVVATVKLFDSPAFPAKLIPTVFPV